MVRSRDQASDHPGKEAVRSWERVAAWGFALSCFFPYPALALGSNTGLQLSQALSLASVPALCGRPPGRSLRVLLSLMSVVSISAFANLVSGEVPSVDVLPKESVALALALLVLWPSEWVSGCGRFGAVLGAAVVALAVHSAIGLIQVVGFAHDEFPLVWLYKNPSFRSIEQWSVVYARYIKRPCGLFPEPSAMGASLGPWLVLLTGLVLDPRLGERVNWRVRGWAALALGSGFALLALSRSGSAFPTMGAVLVVWTATTLRGRGRGPDRGRGGHRGLGRFLVPLLILAAVVGVLGYAAYRLSQGFGERVDSSWGLRALSIQTGLSANTDPFGLVFGVGPGQSTPVLQRHLAWVPLPEDEEELAVFSLVVSFYMENGLLGLLAMLGVLSLTLYAIARSGAVVLGLCALGTWLVGIVLTTSYWPLSAIWLFLAVLLSWDRLFPTTSAVGPEGCS
jgi:hypothetical protein